MLDTVINSDGFLKIVGLLTALITMLTAIVTLRKTRTVEKIDATTASRLTLLSFEKTQTKRLSPRVWKYFVGASGVLSLLMTAAYAIIFVSWPSTIGAVGLLFFGACTVGYAVILKRWWGNLEPASLVQRDASLNVKADYEQLVADCIAALKRMNARISGIDSKDKIIEAKTGLSLRSFGEIIVIQITEIGASEYTVNVKSSSLMRSTIIDYGKNASNITRFVDELTGIK